MDLCSDLSQGAFMSSCVKPGISHDPGLSSAAMVLKGFGSGEFYIRDSSRTRQEAGYGSRRFLR